MRNDSAIAAVRSLRSALAGAPEPVGDVLAGRQMRKQRQVLEHEADAAFRCADD